MDECYYFFSFNSINHTRARLSAYFICVLILLDRAQRNEPQSHVLCICHTEITDSTRDSITVLVCGRKEAGRMVMLCTAGLMVPSPQVSTVHVAVRTGLTHPFQETWRATLPLLKLKNLMQKLKNR